MATLLKLGPADHGRPLSWDEYITGDYKEGYKYELIGGRLYVAPMAGSPENTLDVWLFLKMVDYSRQRPDMINYVTYKSRVFVPDTAEGEVTAPEPDLSAYRDYPHETPVRDRDWRDVSPILVAEVLVDADPDKDLVRNPGLFLRVPSVREYWVLDGREDVERPALVVHRRYRGRWSVHAVAGGGTYASPRLLPGFALELDVRQ